MHLRYLVKYFRIRQFCTINRSMMKSSLSSFYRFKDNKYMIMAHEKWTYLLWKLKMTIFFEFDVMKWHGYNDRSRWIFLKFVLRATMKNQFNRISVVVWSILCLIYNQQIGREIDQASSDIRLSWFEFWTNRETPIICADPSKRGVHLTYTKMVYPQFYW